ncbi:hypothetical protein F5Y18DRAFT_216949 [Xylariaceae sp. FL1019]|nr:hypothetical protein F5Y18DRAFT_216949 [Xylariaceae sp. FL1019]
MADASPSLLWTVVLLVTALSLAFGVIGLILTILTHAYIAAPREITTFVDTVDCSITENESHDADVSKVLRLEDKVRLGRLLREIQKQGDELREDLNRLLVEEGSTTLHTSARVLWAVHRKQLEERVRRLDMLRMRFLVIYMGIVASTVANTAAEKPRDHARSVPKNLPEKTAPATPRSGVNKALLDGIRGKPPLRRITTQAIGHSEKIEHTHRSGWHGVVAELQRSPILRQRHASIEEAMRSPPPMSPISSPLVALSPVTESSTPTPLKLG